MPPYEKLFPPTQPPSTAPAMAMLPTSPLPPISSAPDPMQAQPVASAMSPQQPLFAQQQPQYFNPGPYALADQARQDRFAAAADELLQSALQGGSKKAQAEMVGTNIFGNAIGGLMALVGSPATASGGAQVIQDTYTKVQDMRQERRRQQQDAWTGLKTMVDIMETTSPSSQKNLASALSANFKQQKIDIDVENAKTRRFRAVNANEIAVRKLTETERHNKALESIKETLGKAGITYDYAKLNAMIDISNAKNAIWQKIAALQNATKNRALDITEQANLENWKYKYKALNEQLLQRARQTDVEMQALGARRNAQGELVLGGVKLPSLVDMGVGVDADIESLEDKDEAAITKAETYLNQPPVPQVAAPAAAQTPVVPNAPTAGPQVVPNAPKAIPTDALKASFAQKTKGWDPAAKTKEKLRLANWLVSTKGMSLDEATAAVKGF